MGKPLFLNRIDRMDYSEKESGDCESCRFFLRSENTCLLWLQETHSFESCMEWKEKQGAE